ncbi:MAG: YybH family protein [Arenicella sp.]
MTTKQVDHKAVESTLKSIVAACTHGDFKELEKHFHTNMVIEGPEFRQRKEGRDQSIQHYREFHRNVDIQKFKDSDYQTQIWGDTAIASYHFEAQLKTAGEVRRDTGRDLYAFTREEGEWRAVWNSLTQYDHGQ